MSFPYTSQELKRGTFQGALVALVACVFVSLCSVCTSFPQYSSKSQPNSSGIPSDATQSSSPFLPLLTTAVAPTQGLTSTATFPTSLPVSPSPIFTPSDTSPVGAGQLHVYILDVGQGLSVLIIAPTGQAALFDGGPTEAGPSVLDDLKKYGVQHLSLAIASHGHLDHIGGMIIVLKSIPVDEIVTNGQPDTTSAYNNFLDAALASGAQYIEAGRGDSFSLGDIVLQVYSPPAPHPTGDLNNDSLVIHFQYGQIAFQLEGDADMDAESQMLAFGLNVRSDVLQAGHHCSKTASGLIFLQAVRPKYAVCSLGAGNSYGFPHAEVLRNLLSVGATIFRTDQNGIISFTTDGNTLNVREEK